MLDRWLSRIQKQTAYNLMMLVYMLESEIFRQISAKLLPKTKMQHYCGDLNLGWAGLQQTVFNY